MHLSLGDSGPAVEDVQQRLRDLGCATDLDPEGSFGVGTRAAVEAFQYRRGLRVDGVCGPETWSVLVEAGRRLGDRFLYRRSPMLKGDDVAELQQRLSALGFDTGRVDGIFGDQTSAALAEFQRNAALPVDGIAGADTVAELLRFGSRHQDTELVSTVRDRERLRQSARSLLNLRVAIGEAGGLSATVGALRRELVTHGMAVSTLHHPSQSVQASEANAGKADVYLGFRVTTGDPACHTAYYSGYQFTSAGGHVLADMLLARLTEALELPHGESRGMTLPILRETRMPAVICEISPAELVTESGNKIARAVGEAIVEWAAAEWD